ncbi:UNVERIFIED_CONTAM: NTP transferase domain-containing protein [Halobacillus marinus]
MKRWNKVGILLAAGQSRRMGENKLALPFEGSTIGSRALSRALDSVLDHVFVVVRKGDSLHWIDPLLKDPSFSEKWSAVRCTESADGQSKSLAQGVRAAQAYGASFVITLLADQPFLSASIINKLITCYSAEKEHGIYYVASVHEGIVQPPVLMGAPIFEHLLSLEGDAGAGRLLMQFAERGRRVPFRNGWSFFDVDTRADYAWVRSMEVEAK